MHKHTQVLSHSHSHLTKQQSNAALSPIISLEAMPMWSVLSNNVHVTGPQGRGRCSLVSSSSRFLGLTPLPLPPPHPHTHCDLLFLATEMMSMRTVLASDAEQQLSCAGLSKLQPTTGSTHFRAKQDHPPLCGSHRRRALLG